jgi:uncharacterized membrane protein YccC
MAAGKDFLKARLSGLMSYLWQHMSPRREKTEDTIKALAEIKLVEEREKTNREKEITKRERERTKQLEILRDIADGDRATSEKALDLIKWSMTTSNRAVGRLEYLNQNCRKWLKSLRQRKHERMNSRATKMN